MVSSDSNTSASYANVSTPVPFPHPEDAHDNSNPTKARARTSTNASSASSRIRSASIKLMEANPPPGMWAATGSVASKAPSLVDIRRGSFGSEGWDEQRQREHRRGSQESSERPANNRKGSSGKLGVEPFPALTEERPSFESRECAPIPQFDGHSNAQVVGAGIKPITSQSTDKSVDVAMHQPLCGSHQVRRRHHPNCCLYCRPT